MTRGVFAAISVGIFLVAGVGGFFLGRTTEDNNAQEETSAQAQAVCTSAFPNFPQIISAKTLPKGAGSVWDGAKPVYYFYVPDPAHPNTSVGTPTVGQTGPTYVCEPVKFYWNCLRRPC